MDTTMDRPQMQLGIVELELMIALLVQSPYYNDGGRIATGLVEKLAIELAGR